MLTLNGKTLKYDKAFEHEGIQYPKNWLRLTTLEEKQAIGIIEVPDEPTATWDQRFYWGVDNPKDLDELKERWTATVKQTAGQLLSETDWYVVRQNETGVTIPTAVTERRVEIRAFSNEKESSIAACNDVPTLAAYLTSQEFYLWEQVVEENPTPVE